ncbi:hypothetical protein [Undibacterium flavidum]|uniref:Uncharacterized protein n=1 Tax=Undibacterium flavidum TaxID=2762297 RepID=A0ABR6Y9L0_9BURK|nr:hypothetical protein [Undibacterium flavidum]MBC3873313.1 hypothetical protein [Undibacterium flavidum]
MNLPFSPASNSPNSVLALFFLALAFASGSFASSFADELFRSHQYNAHRQNIDEVKRLRWDLTNCISKLNGDDDMPCDEVHINKNLKSKTQVLLWQKRIDDINDHILELQKFTSTPPNKINYFVRNPETGFQLSLLFTFIFSAFGAVKLWQWGKVQAKSEKSINLENQKKEAELILLNKNIAVFDLRFEIEKELKKMELVIQRENLKKLKNEKYHTVVRNGN